MHAAIINITPNKILNKSIIIILCHLYNIIIIFLFKDFIKLSLNILLVINKYG